MKETTRRRKLQIAYNQKHGIKPKTIKKPVADQQIILKDTKHIPVSEKKKMIPQLEKEMREAADQLDFEMAIALRDRVAGLKKDLGEE